MSLAGPSRDALVPLAATANAAATVDLADLADDLVARGAAGAEVGSGGDAADDTGAADAAEEGGGSGGDGDGGGIAAAAL